MRIQYTQYSHSPLAITIDITVLLNITDDHV